MISGVQEGQDSPHSIMTKKRRVAMALSLPGEKKLLLVILNVNREERSS